MDDGERADAPDGEVPVEPLDDPPPDQVASENDADPYAREFAIDQLTGPEDAE
ncbi:MAG: hypothetical protein V7603_3772 [Micromonosporaceae bacterium]